MTMHSQYVGKSRIARPNENSRIERPRRLIEMT